MSASFFPANSSGRALVRCTCECENTCPACQLTLNLNERNWRDLLAYLGLEVAPSGTIDAPRLAELCRARLAMVEAEAEIPETDAHRRGQCRVVTAGRSVGYLRERTGELLQIARAAGDAYVSWG